jgi:hypothetical protein
MAATAVANLRATAAAWGEDDAALDRLVRDLSEQSDTFRTLWATHEVRVRPSDVARLNHPLVGPLQLHYELLTSLVADGQVLVVYHAGHDRPGRDALAALKRLTTEPLESPLRSADGRPDEAPVAALRG